MIFPTIFWGIFSRFESTNFPSNENAPQKKSPSTQLFKALKEEPQKWSVAKLFK